MSSPAAAAAEDYKSSQIGLSDQPSILEHSQNLTNPGSYEELHKKTKEVFPMIFEGFKFQLNKMISNHFQVNHTINMSSATPSGYKFGATYIGTNQVTPAEVYPIILGDIDSTGNMNAQIIHQLHPNVKSRLIAQIQEGVLAGYQLTNDYKAKSFTASVTAVNTDIVQNSGVILAHYLHRVSSNLDLGTELLFQYGRQVPNNRVAFYSVGWRYFGTQWQLSGALNPLGSLHLCYHHQSKSPIQFGVELEANMRTMECVSTFGYQVDLSKSNVVFRGQVDSNWNVGAVMEKRLLPLPFSFTMSGYLNHVKSAYKFGIGLVIG